MRFSLGLWEIISSPARASASLRPRDAIHSAPAQRVPATSSVCTGCIGFFPGPHLHEKDVNIKFSICDKSSTDKVFMGCFMYPYTAATVSNVGTGWLHMSV